MKNYNKLIRDKIPEIISNQGKKYKITILSDEQYVIELKKKIKEEVQEYMETDNNQDALEELADLLELIHSLSKVHGASFEELDGIRKIKAAKRGGFENKIFLIEAE